MKWVHRNRSSRSVLVVSFFSLFSIAFVLLYLLIEMFSCLAFKFLQNKSSQKMLNELSKAIEEDLCVPVCALRRSINFPARLKKSNWLKNCRCCFFFNQQQHSQLATQIICFLTHSMQTHTQTFMNKMKNTINFN